MVKMNKQALKQFFYDTNIKQTMPIDKIFSINRQFFSVKRRFQEGIFPL